MHALWLILMATQALQPDEDPRTSPTIKLSNGVVMPRVGYGCAGKASARYVERALREGVRLIDTAQADEWYDEAAAAEGLRASGVERRDVTVVTKLHPKNHGATTARRLIDESARRFGGYVDVFLQHYLTCWDGLCGNNWRNTVEGDWRDSWRAMEAAYDEGKVKAIGVSNVSPREVDELMQFARIKPHIIQAWMDPFHSSAKLRETCERHNIRFMAYSTLGTQWSMQGRANPVLSSSKLREYGDPARVALSWALLRNAVVIPRSFSNERIAANARLYDGGVLSVGLDAAALEAIDALDGMLDQSDDVQAVFANEGDEAVRLFWKGPDGDVEVGSAAPGASVEISTYRGHEFAAKLERHDEAFATYRTGAARRQTFRVRDPETQDL